jgi:glutathione S-transferase
VVARGIEIERPVQEAPVLTLYHNDMSVCSAKVRVALAEKGVTWEAKHLDLRAGEAQSPEYLLLNPNAVVPTLVVDGTPLVESTLICEYVDDAYPAPALKPPAAIDRHRMRDWTKQLDDTLHAAVGTLSFCIAFRHQWMARTAQERAQWLASIPQPERRERSRANMEHGLDSPYFTPALQRWLKFFADAERALTVRSWLAGDQFSLAEVGYAPYLARLQHLGFEPVFAQHPRVAEWAERVAARPAVQEGVTRWLNPTYVEIFDRERPHVAPRIAVAMA